MPEPEVNLTLAPAPAPAGAKPRRRGAQPGNINALKHGFYSRRFSPLEHRDLEDCPISDPFSEVVMLRVVQRRLFELSETVEDFDRLRLLLNTIAKSAVAMDRLMRTSSLFTGSAHPLDGLLAQAFSGTLEDLNAKPPLR
jgi:hypothetical protein